MDLSDPPLKPVAIAKFCVSGSTIYAWYETVLSFLSPAYLNQLN